MTESRKNQSEDWTYFTQLFIYFITVNKYRFCILVIGYINVLGIGIGYKKNLYRSITSCETVLSGSCIVYSQRNDINKIHNSKCFSDARLLF